MNKEITLRIILEKPVSGVEYGVQKVPGTGKDGGPNCATVKPFNGWKSSELEIIFASCDSNEF